MVTNKIFKKHERRTNHKHSEPIIYVCMFDWVVSAVRVCYLTERMCSVLMCECVLSLMILRHFDIIMWSNHFCFLHSTRRVNKMAPTGIYSLPFVFVCHFITSSFWNCVTVWIIFLVKKKKLCVILFHCRLFKLRRIQNVSSILVYFCMCVLIESVWDEECISTVVANKTISAKILLLLFLLYWKKMSAYYLPTHIFLSLSVSLFYTRLIPHWNSPHLSSKVYHTYHLILWLQSIDYI